MAKQYLKLQPQHAENELLKLAKIVERLRFYSNEWQTKFGYDNRKNMKYWEDKADEWLQQNLITSNEK